MKPKPAAKPKTKTQPNTDTMTTTTQQAAEPTPAYAFSVFAKTRPALQEIAAITGKSFEERKRPDWATAWEIKMALDAAPKPKPTDDIAFIADRAAPLKAQLRAADLPKDEALEIQRRILEIAQSPFKPVRDHQKKIDRLKEAIDTELEAFEEWLKNDPEGAAAQVADEAYYQWKQADRERQEAEQELRDAETKEAERQARAEKYRARCRDEASDLQHEIGAALFDTNPEHPDIDGQTMQDFTAYAQDHWDDWPLNAILTGPPGTGKSRALAAAAVANCQRSGRENVEWITGYEFAELVSNLSTDKREEATARLCAITEASTLYFDDLGSANFTTARTSRFFRLIDERYRRRVPIFISTNYSTAQLKKLFTATGDSKDEAVRILRRIIGTPAEPLARFFHFKRPQEAMK